jgi:hypothetical protein
MRRTGSVAAIAWLALALPVGAGECDFEAWSRDRDPAGLNVRAAPTATSRIVGHLPPPRDEGGTDFAVEVHVVGSRDGWLEIDRAAFAGYDLPKKTVFTGRGWVSGRLLDVSVQDERVRSAPEATAKILDEARETAAGERDVLRVDRIRACKGRWIEMDGRLAPGGADGGRAVMGWVTGLCGNQATTCP